MADNFNVSDQPEQVSVPGGIGDATAGDILTWDAAGEASLIAIGAAGEVLTSNGAGAEPTWQAAGGAGTFLALTDTPASYAGAGGLAVAVNAGATGLEFVSFPADAVDSVFGRTGTVVAVAGDYSASEVTNDSNVTGTNVDDALNTLNTPQRVSVFNSAAQSIPDSTPTILAFNSERFDTDTMHDNATNNSRSTFTTAGTYAFGLNIKWELESGGDYRIARVLLNGTDEILYDANRDISGGEDDANAVSGIRTFSAADFIEVEVEHDEGAALDVRAAGDLIQFWAQRIQ